MNKKVWHFSNGKLTNDRQDNVVPGLSLACNDDKIGLCDYGFHGSYDILDALKYAPGNILSLCEVGGKIIEGDDKIVSSIRRHIVVVDIERTLHLFAIWCAEQSLSLLDNPDIRSTEALRIKRLWLDGNATDEELAAASDAAWDAASDAAWDAARAAASDAASDAARAAARAAASEAARAAVWAAQNIILTNMVLALPEFEGISL